MAFLSLVASFFLPIVYASDVVLSPLPADFVFPSSYQVTQNDTLPKPEFSFGDLYPTPTPTILIEETPMPTAKPTPVPQKTKKSSYMIALLGDSMTDTLGPEAPHLKTALKNIYPATAFTIKNYGVGGTNIEYGIERITNAYSYLGQSIPSLVSANPDLVVLESFAYNPFSDADGGITRHWLNLGKAVTTLKNNLPQVKIVIAATIAPNASVFGDGAAGLSFDPIAKWQKVDIIKKYLDNTVKFAQGENLPLANAYTPSLMRDGNGNLTYINGGDHIHYSDAGRAFFSSIIASTIGKNKLLE